MHIRIKAGLPVVWLGRGDYAVGVEPGPCHTVRGLPSTQQRMLSELEVGTDTRHLRRLARNSHAPAEMADALVRELTQAGVLETFDAGQAGSAPDVASWCVVDDDGGHHRAARRAAMTVEVRGAGAVGLRVAQVLGAAGVGRIRIADPAPVEESDVFPGGYRRTDVGRPRRLAAAELLADTPRERERCGACPGSCTIAATCPRPLGPADLTILVDALVADPVASRGLTRADQAHLLVAYGPTFVEIGPLVVPGVSACLRCVNLWRTQADATWPVRATQLLARAAGGRWWCETSVASTAAALAASHALQWLDGPTEAAADPSQVVTMTLGSVLPRTAQIRVHPQCGCTRLPDACDDTGCGPEPARSRSLDLPGASPAALGGNHLAS